MSAEPDWERIQKKTFVKWCNTHLSKAYGKDGEIDDVLTAWENGVALMKLLVCLYKENEKEPEKALSMPKLKEKEMNPTQRIQKVANLNIALGMMKQAGIAMRGVGAENLCDHGDRDKAVILGMIFTIILDYAARGFGGTAAEVKRALLEWVNKKTDGYDQVNPPGVKNFTKDWRNGLAWCALIHKHRPDLIDYDQCLNQSNQENLEMAFSVADEQLGIPRLLDVEDCDVDNPDEKSIITYTMEYFFRFASEGLKEAAAKQLEDWLAFLRDVYERQNEYERRARELLGWTQTVTGNWESYDFGSTLSDAMGAFNGLKEFVTSEKPGQEGEKLDLEALFAEIQTTLKVNGCAPYVPPEDVTPEKIEEAMHSVAAAQTAYGAKVREARMKFVEKKEDHSGEELMAQIKESFDHYDANHSASLSAIEFNAACMEMGVALKTQEEKDALFSKIAEGNAEISFDQYFNWMKGRMVATLDDPNSVKGIFSTLADGKQGLSDADLAHFSEEDQEFVRANFQKNGEDQYDYGSFVDSTMGGGY